MQNNLTIKEIAKLANSSVSTVSRVINNSKNVSENTRKRIQTIIDQNNFQPSMIARSMVSKKTNTIALIVSDVNNPYFISLVSQIEEICIKQNYSILLLNTMTAEETITNLKAEIKTFNIVKEKHVDGVIILGGEVDKIDINPKYATELNDLSKNIPTVVVSQTDSSINSVFIERHQKLSGTMITQHLLANGYKKIGFIGGRPDVKITKERFNGFKETLSMYSTFQEKYVILNDYYVQDGYNAIEKLISTDSLPQALVTINDAVAIGAIRALKDHNLEVPKDVALASCDLFPNSEFTIPRLTTIDHNNNQLGLAALQQLLNLIEHETLPHLPIPYPKLIIRESCGTKFKQN